MLSKLRIVLSLLSIAAMIVPIQSNGQASSRRFRNLYSDDVNISNVTNVFRANVGLLNFLDQGQRYLNKELPDITPKFGDVYDFVVIGAGTAGAAIAARLSEISQVKVLLIEAGSNENLIMDIPVSAHFLQLSNDINWKYRTKPSNKYCLGMNDKSCNWAKGKVMGGSSVLNYMIATRGGAEDYDRWAKMGNEGWAYKDVLKYFKKLETIDIPELKSDTIYHGKKGPLNIAYPPFHTVLAEAFLKAGKELKYPTVDYNGKDIIGFSYLQSTIKNGMRMSSNRAYLYPIHDRKNLHVTQKSMIVPNYFNDVEDIETMIAGIKVAIKIGQTKAMQMFDSQLSNDTFPECEGYTYDSFAYWECAIRTISFTTYHYSGTCKMGPREDPTAVVDPKLKVIGVQGLRVADASIMPEIIAGHTNIPTYMIAEKLADMVKEEWGYLKKSQS
ncbi:Glucose dehydrogenase [acceptor] [Camponotus floridanus]|uniref:Glucose dehydrogenase [acceptor] n=1 Tax=Camponotus floridanus TaxID=104421 RepID=E2A5J4_CAMFO|nr:Glucose dehydrogenase [acceptor] [Camponotus floridanus]